MPVLKLSQALADFTHLFLCDEVSVLRVDRPIGMVVLKLFRVVPGLTNSNTTHSLQGRGHVVDIRTLTYMHSAPAPAPSLVSTPGSASSSVNYPYPNSNTARLNPHPLVNRNLLWNWKRVESRLNP